MENNTKSNLRLYSSHILQKSYQWRQIKWAQRSGNELHNYQTIIFWYTTAEFIMTYKVVSLSVPCSVIINWVLCLNWRIKLNIKSTLDNRETICSIRLSFTAWNHIVHINQVSSDDFVNRDIHAIKSNINTSPTRHFIVPLTCWHISYNQLGELKWHCHCCYIYLYIL